MMVVGKNVKLEDLFDYSRVFSTMGFFSLLLYAPFGLMLLIVRVFIGFHVFLITLVLPKHSYLRSLILRPFSAILGVVYTQEGLQNIQPACKVLVANYTTALDPAVFHLAVPHHLVSVWDYSGLMGWMLGCVDLGAKDGRETLVQNAKKHCQSSFLPLLAFPERETTNGRVGLLQFSSWPFFLDQPVQPVTIKVTRPFFAVAPSLINSFLLTDLFWLLFSPITFFHFSFLPVQETSGDAAADTQATQAAMASHMALVETAFTSQDKLELIKRLNFESNIADRRQETSQERMGASKAAALSAVLNASKRDECSQRNVFEKNSYYRHLSFQDKKTVFLEAARKRYLEKNSS